MTSELYPNTGGDLAGSGLRGSGRHTSGPSDLPAGGGDGEAEGEGVAARPSSFGGTALGGAVLEGRRRRGGKVRPKHGAGRWGAGKVRPKHGAGRWGAGKVRPKHGAGRWGAGIQEGGCWGHRGRRTGAAPHPGRGLETWDWRLGTRRVESSRVQHRVQVWDLPWELPQQVHERQDEVQHACLGADPAGAVLLGVVALWACAAWGRARAGPAPLASSLPILRDLADLSGASYDHLLPGTGPWH